MKRELLFQECSKESQDVNVVRGMGEKKNIDGMHMKRNEREEAQEEVNYCSTTIYQTTNTEMCALLV